MDINDLLNIFKDFLNQGDLEQLKSIRTPEEDLEEFKGILEIYISNCEDEMEQRIQSERILDIVKPILTQKDQIKMISDIKKLSPNKRKFLFSQLSNLDKDFTLEKFENRYSELKRMVRGSTTQKTKMASAIAYFTFFLPTLQFLYVKEEKNLEETILNLDKNYKNYGKIKKLYKNLTGTKIILISEALEQVLLTELNLTEEGQSVVKNAIKFNNERYYQVEEDKKRQEQQEKFQRQKEIELLKEKQRELTEQKSKHGSKSEEIEILELDDVFLGVDSVDPLFEHNVEMYTRMICEHEDLKTLESVFPPKNIKKYHKLITRIITNIREAIEEQTREVENVTDLHLEQYFIDVTANYTEKLNRLLAYNRESDKTEGIHEEQNPVHLFFATNNSKVLLLEDLKDHKYADQRNCVDTLTLLYKLQAGDFGNSNVKSRKLQNNNALEDVFEMKAYQSRILFKRLPGNNYYVIMARIKQDDNSLYDRKQIEYRSDIVKNEYQALKTAILNQTIPAEFLNQEQEVIQIAENMLLPKSGKKL